MFKRIAVPNYPLFDSLKTSQSEPLPAGDEWARESREADQKHLNKLEIYVEAFEVELHQALKEGFIVVGQYPCETLEYGVGVTLLLHKS